MTDANPKRPMTEAEWERAMLENDIRAARFGDLLETFMDHPLRDEIIAREMGWDQMEVNEEIAEALEEALAEQDEDDYGADGFDPDEFSPEVFYAAAEGADEEDDNTTPFDEPAQTEAEGDEAGEADDEPLGRLGAEDPELAAMEAYTRGFAWGVKVHNTLKPYLQQLDQGHFEDEPDDPLLVASGECFLVAVKIVGGHGMGYDDRQLCGNIVKCKQSLAAADNSLTAMETLRDSATVPAEILDPLIAEGREVRRLVAERIAELRSRVWWE